MEGDPSLQKYPPWGPWKTPAGCAGQHMAGGGAGRQAGAGRGGRRLHLGKKKNPHKTGEFQPIISPAADAH